METQAPRVPWTMTVAQAILQYQNTPIQSIGLSLAQLLFHCQLRDNILSQLILYKPHPEWVVVAQCREEILHHQNLKTVERYDKYTHKLPLLQAGDTIAIQSPLNHRWNTTEKIITPSNQIDNTESGLMDQEGSHLGTTISSENANLSQHQPQY